MAYDSANPMLAKVQVQRMDALLAALLRGAIALLVSAAVVVMFTVSSMLLFQWGLSYETTSGGVFEKLHPGTWLVFLAFTLAMLASGNPFRFLDATIARQPGLLIFFLICLVMIGQLIFVQKAAFTAVIDTFIMPMVLTVMLLRLGMRTKQRLGWFLHVFFAVNAAIGIWELLTGNRLTPFVAGSLLVEGDWRSTALLGHPLANAVVSGCYVVALNFGAAERWPPMLRSAAVVLQLAGLTAFGGRTSLVLALAFVAVAILYGTARFLGGARISLLNAFLLVLALPLAFGAFGMIEASGFFDKLVDRFADDSGSANTRIVLLSLFDRISLTDLLFGPDQAFIRSIQQSEGIELGLESFWIATILGYGLLISFIIFFGLFAFCAELVKASRRGSVAVLLFFFLVASTSVSISAKTHVFGLVVAILLILLRRNDDRDGVAA